MIELGLLILSLVCAAALWAALARLRAAEERRGAAERQVSTLRARLEGEGRERAATAALRPAGDGREAGGKEEREKETGERPEGADAGAHDSEAAPPFVEEAREPPEGDSPHALAEEIEEFFNRTTHPRELLPNETFLRGVELLRAGVYTTADLVAHAVNSPPALACMALEALARRAPDSSGEAESRLLETIGACWHWPRFYALRALDAQGRGPVLARLLARLNATWRDYVPLSSLREFVARRLAAGERVAPGELVAEVERARLNAEQTEEVAQVLGDLSDTLPPELIEGFAEWREGAERAEFLKSFGRVWEADARGAAGGGAEVFLTPTVEARIAEIEAALKEDPPRGVLLVGESGTGKTAVLRALAGRLREEGWVVFEAGAAEVMSGQQYIGMIEGRLRELVRRVADRRVLWVAPNFHELLWAGRHTQNPTGVLDMILPEIESGQLRIVGETQPAPFEQLLRLRPKLRTAVQVCRLAPLAESETLELARRWAERHADTKSGDDRHTHGGRDERDGPPLVSEETLREAWQLARQYLGDKAAPGNLLLLLEATRRRLSAEGRAGVAITLDDLLVTLSQVTGLPANILDERVGLDISELRAFFDRRVLGQPEAIECLVERVAMVKAGLTDPTRPQGVFLFVGPTGTGKTEIAKTLAEFLFGSPERMIRLDMSEFQTPDSLERLLGETSETGDSAALVNQIRKQPFSVVLLDEFEKAHPQVWDLFLQVFDDGRLTDRRGAAADFRHSVIIMTSNLGATLPHGASVGFALDERAQFAAGSVERAVARSFRREFLNRIDRVVVFRPLGRAVMRDLLRKELNDVLLRRGLRTRQWAVEWDEAAVEFLLEKGFTADLGARPLKRAVERYLLSPLALAIVNHQFPEGDQFLFVRPAPDGRSLDVQFVDPDAPEPAAADDARAEKAEAEPPRAEDGRAELSLASIALDARGSGEELALLREKFEEMSALAESEEWRGRKDEALRRTESPDFWNSPARFSVLGLVEYMDRVEAGLDTAGSLLARLGRAAAREDGGHRTPRDLMARLAERLYLLDAALRGMEENEPRDAFLLVSSAHEAGDDRASAARFARRLAGMYRSWAEKRRMRFALLEERGGDGGADARGGDATGEYRALAAVSGYAAYSILKREAGLHLLESPHGDKSFSRARVLVRVVGQPEEPAGHGPDALLRQAERALAEDHSASPAPVVRRYREEPSPLVRYSARGWRTGRLDRVLAGDFDIMS
jgi:ATP-dependent Clp protease ATP-binding subunit ClpC